MKIPFNFWAKNNPDKVRKKVRFTPTRFFESKNGKLKKKSISYHIALLIFQYGIAIFLSALAIYLKIHFSSQLGTNSPFLLLFSAVLISGWIGGLGPAFIATICCTIGAMYFFLLPTYSFNKDSQTSVEIAIFIIEGVLIGGLLETRRRSDALLTDRIRKQAVISQLGHAALTSPNIDYFYTKVSSLITETLDVKYCKILELLPGKKSFVLRGGVGWNPGLVNRNIVTAGKNSQGEYALLSDEPIVVKDLKKEKRFYSSELLMSHGITSGINVIIPGKKGPFGILGVYSEKKRHFTSDDVYFVQAIANIMATEIEKKSSETNLKNSEIRFKRLFDSNIIGAFISDFDGKFLEANDSLLSLIEYSRKDLQQGKVHKDTMTPPEYRYLSNKALKDLKTRGSSDVYEKEYITKSGKRIPVLLAESRIDSKSEICIGFVLDISKQKEIEKRKNEFIGMASHELKTPITSLKILTQFLQQKMMAHQQSEPSKYLEKINKQVDKLTDLINDLLDVTQIQAGKLKLKKTLFNLDELVQEVSDEIQSVTTTHKIVLQTESKTTILADSSRISQVITNLITNAIKYAPANTEIVVSTNEKNNNAVVSVQDFGHGIEEKYQESIFEQFFRINENDNTTYPGLGMGLYISKEIIARHQGKMWVESQKGRGSSFFFSIPLPEETYEKTN